MTEHIDTMTAQKFPYRPTVVGAVIGLSIGSGWASYGTGGLMILALLGGTFQIVFLDKPPSKMRMLAYSFSLCLSFFVIGFNRISDPFSSNSILIMLAMISIPVGLAAVVDEIRVNREKNHDEQAAASNGDKRP